MEKKKLFETFLTVMETVYGKYDPSSTKWKPKLYSENKGRYLWTDAFGVCNFLTLYYETGQQQYLDQADALIEDVHNTLGRERIDSTSSSSSSSSSSNLPKRLGESTDDHPLRGGLRIGKVHSEGHSDGDGQYFHYLTKWAFALNRMSVARSDKRYNDWAIDLIKAIHPRFVYRSTSGRLRMVWKMSIDLSHPAVPSEGNLDPYDGYVTYRIVQETAKEKILEREIDEMENMVMNKFNGYSSFDALDLGEALWLTHFFPEEEWSKRISSKSLTSLETLWSNGEFQDKRAFRLGMRLAFREFGTTLGVQVHPHASRAWKSRVETIHAFWSENIFIRDSDITPVMYCTSLIPGAFTSGYCESGTTMKNA